MFVNQNNPIKAIVNYLFSIVQVKSTYKILHYQIVLILQGLFVIQNFLARHHHDLFAIYVLNCIKIRLYTFSPYVSQSVLQYVL